MKRVALVNVVTRENCGFGETQNVEIAYPITDSEVCKFEEVVKESELMARCVTENYNN